MKSQTCDSVAVLTQLDSARFARKLKTLLTQEKVKFESELKPAWRYLLPSLSTAYAPGGELRPGIGFSLSNWFRFDDEKEFRKSEVQSIELSYAPRFAALADSLLEARGEVLTCFCELGRLEEVELVEVKLDEIYEYKYSVDDIDSEAYLRRKITRLKQRLAIERETDKCLLLMKELYLLGELK